MRQKSLTIASSVPPEARSLKFSPRVLSLAGSRPADRRIRKAALCQSLSAIKRRLNRLNLVENSYQPSKTNKIPTCSWRDDPLGGRGVAESCFAGERRALFVSSETRATFDERCDGQIEENK